MAKKIVQCSKCGKGGFVLVGENNASATDLEKLEGISEVLNSQIIFCKVVYTMN